MKHFTFFWSPEGRPVLRVNTGSIDQARAAFRRIFADSHAKYMGEVYTLNEQQFKAEQDAGNIGLYAQDHLRTVNP